VRIGSQLTRAKFAFLSRFRAASGTANREWRLFLRFHSETLLEVPGPLYVQFCTLGRCAIPHITLYGINDATISNETTMRELKWYETFLGGLVRRADGI
jgi:hypothetical protein